MAIEKYNEDKAQWLDSFSSERPDLFFPEGWSQAQKDEALESLRTTSTRKSMYMSIPMVCRGDACPIKNVCPLYAKNIHPLKEKCPLETQMVIQFMEDLYYELNVNQNSITEVSMVRDLVDLEIQHIRKSNYLANEDMIIDEVVGVDKDGHVVIKKSLHPMVELEDKILKRKKEIRNQMMATREQRAKVGKSAIDSALVISDIMSKVNEVERQKESALKKMLGTSVEDEYTKADKGIIDLEPLD